ncbi:hypothetical protein Salat_2058400 [Sesamum alatum]|uniref:Uncharacterized protein n=1 Tax=Sesamum alatum TaxID=300844 RepID=A0AAE1Y0S7_9LAMI|nr:hypothetical protein Salat_2058400 [Sesamum alatum]
MTSNLEILRLLGETLAAAIRKRKHHSPLYKKFKLKRKAQTFREKPGPCTPLCHISTNHVPKLIYWLSGHLGLVDYMCCARGQEILFIRPAAPTYTDAQAEYKQDVNLHLLRSNL